MTINEDMQEVCKGYKLGSDIPFTATYRGKFDKTVHANMERAAEGKVAEDVVINVEAVAE